MNPSPMQRTLRIVVAVATVTAGTAAFSATAEAAPGAWRERAAQARAQRPRGDFTRETTRQRTERGRLRTDTWTGENGRSATRRREVTRDPEAGVRTRRSDWTGPEGGTLTRERRTERTENGWRRSGSVATGDGRTATRETEVARDPEAGERTRRSMTTLPDGRTVTGDDVLRRTEDGYTRSTTVTGPDGATATRDVNGTYDPETGTWSRVVDVDRP